MINSKILQSVCQEVYRRMPEVEGSKPTIKKQVETGKQNSESASRYLLIFSNKESKKKTAPFTTYVRVTVDSQGNILKISSSR